VPAPHAPKKRFGQHFLHDRQVVRRILASFAPRAEDIVAEIGPGQGALTVDLAPAVAHLHAIELDRDLASTLSARCPAPNLTVHGADALRFDFCSLVSGSQKLRVIGNLPYNVSTPLLFHLLDDAPCIADMCFMLQKEVVDRLSAPPGGRDYGRLSVMVQARCAVERLFVVGPGAFTPPPKVDSAIVRLVPYETAPVTIADDAVFARVVAAAFAQRRKTLRNTLRGLVTAEAMARLGIDPQRRAETLSVADFARLAEVVGGNE
jgi:16S rRNA (adenine1518-N6/adenine1519-N6)-dimethyltransferase